MLKVRPFSKIIWSVLVFRFLGISVILFSLAFLSACSIPPRPSSIPMSEISDSPHYSYHVRKLIQNALILGKRRLAYRFGSSNPNEGGMDCSGVIYYLLRETAHFTPPRDASEQYVWVKKSGHLHHVYFQHFYSITMHDLRPGDLLFWTGTYHTNHYPPITHVMLYLGKNKQGQPLMFGATEGIYNNHIVRGVGVFDFFLPDPDPTARLVGYGCIPYYTCTTHVEKKPVQLSQMELRGEW